MGKETTMNNFVKFAATGLALTGLALAQSSKPQITLEGFLVHSSIKDGKTVESFEKASRAQPGEIVEYRLKAVNPGSTAISNLNVDLPVPRETSYLEGTAAGPNNATLLASFDAKRSFGQLPLKRKIIKDGKASEELVKANEFTNLRWAIKGAIPAGQTLEFKARVKVK
jgi:uncharacterized repeat protein (TIGR01451 family)